MAEYSTEIPQHLLDAKAAAEAKLTQLTDEAGERDETTADEHVSSDVTPSPRDTDGEEWKHKYEVLQGKYNAELPRALHEAAYWRDRAGQLQTQLDQLQAATPPATTPTPMDDIDLSDWVGEEGDKALRQWMARQKAEIESRVTQVANVAAQSAEQSFWAQVHQAFPNYGQMQTDPGLNQWLAEAWPGSRETRLQQATALAQRFDAPQFIGLLRAYSPTSSAEPSKKPAMPSPTPRRAAGSGQVPPQPTSMTGQEYLAAGARVIEFKKQGRFEEAAKLERELHTAMRERRIT